MTELYCPVPGVQITINMASERHCHHQLHWIVGPIRQRSTPIGPILRLVAPRGQLYGRIKSAMSLVLTDGQEVTFTVEAKDAVGNPASLPAPGAFSVSDPAVLALTDNGDNSCLVVATGMLGTGETVSFTAADDSGQPIIGSCAIDVVSGPVTEVDLVPGEVTDKPVE